MLYYEARETIVPIGPGAVYDGDRVSHKDLRLDAKFMVFIAYPLHEAIKDIDPPGAIVVTPWSVAATVASKLPSSTL